jgi:hypothetical protein
MNGVADMEAVLVLMAEGASHALSVLDDGRYREFVAFCQSIWPRSDIKIEVVPEKEVLGRVDFSSVVELGELVVGVITFPTNSVKHALVGLLIGEPPVGIIVSRQAWGPGLVRCAIGILGGAKGREFA